MSVLDLATHGAGTTVSSVDVRPPVEIVSPGSSEPPSLKHREISALWSTVLRSLSDDTSSGTSGDATAWQASGLYSPTDERRVEACWAAVYTHGTDELTAFADMGDMDTGEIRIQTGYSENLFQKLAETNPDELINLVTSGRLGPADLTFAAEVIGRVLPSTGSLDVLFELLQNEAPLVREGAAYGLYHHLSQDGVRERLQILSEKDPSPEVRAAILDVLYD
jgi:hypothetical protein